MDLFSSLTATVGLRHVLEDGLAVLDERPVEAARRQYVVGDLAGLLEQAARGVKVTEGNHLFAHARDVPDFEAYSLIFRYLNESYRDTLAAKIAETCAAFRKLSLDQPVDPSEKGTARDFLDQMLRRLNRDRSYQQQPEPEAISLTL